MSNTSALNAISTTTDPADVSARLPIKTLGQDDFLKLLAKQMSSQDPMNPQTDTNFIAQMAQFSQLEQSTAMQKDLAQMGNQQQFLQATGLIGRTVGLQIDSKSAPFQGVVSGVQMANGSAQIIVNGTAFDLSQVVSVSSTATH